MTKSGGNELRGEAYFDRTGTNWREKTPFEKEREAQGVPLRDRRDLLRSYVDVAILRDVIERHAVSNPLPLRWLQRHLLASPATPFSVQKFYDALRSQGIGVGKDTLHTFLGYLEDSFLVRIVSLHSASERQRMVNPRKVYPVDPGLIPVYDRVGRPNLGAALETAVLVELERRGCEVAYVRTREGFEVEEGSGGMPTAFCATWGKEGPVLGAYAEYDAVPGTSQAPVARREPRRGFHRWAAGHTDPHSALGMSAFGGLLATKAAMNRPATKICGAKRRRSARGGRRRQALSVGAGADARDAPEDLVERALGTESAFQGDLEQRPPRRTRPCQGRPNRVDPPAVHVVIKALSDARGQDLRQLMGRGADGPRQAEQVQVAVEVGLVVLHHLLQSCGKRAHLFRRQRGFGVPGAR